MLKTRINVRLAIVCLAAASVGLSMAIISIAKLLLILCALATVLWRWRDPDSASPLSGLWTPAAVLTALFAFALSLLWTVAPQDEALGSFAKYGKLIVVLLMVLLIRDRREATWALGAFMLAQLFLLASSWMLAAHLPVPWATSRQSTWQYSVFSSYLDQGIITAVFAALCWHFRFLAPGRWGGQLAIFVALAALGNVLFVLQGRSGHAVAIVLLSLAIMWELPRRYRAAVVLLPFVLALGLYASSARVRERLSLVGAEVQAYSSASQAAAATSSGTRLHFWKRALQLIGEHPLAGSGVGSWSTEYNRLQHEENPANPPIAGNGNPHQEYLMWGVQLGIPGIVMFLGLLLCLLRDAARLEKTCARAFTSTLAALAVACLFNASLYDAQIGDFFCVLLGLLLALGLATKTAQATTAPFPQEQAS